MAERDIYNYHQDAFKGIYADLVAVLGNKPSQIAFELEAVLSHIAVAKTDPALEEDNLKKALHHLQRAALDASKMLWLEFRNRLDVYIKDSDVRKFCINSPEAEFVKIYEKAEKLALEARRTEIKNVGKNPEASVAQYYEAALEFKKALELVDTDKIREFKKFCILRFIKQQWVGFVVGVLASLLATHLWTKFMCAPPQ
jgi:hypothetical protein